MSEEPNWSKIIHYIYSKSNGKVDPPTISRERLNEDHELSKNLDMNRKELKNSFHQAIDFGLLQLKRENHVVPPESMHIKYFRGDQIDLKYRLRSYSLELSAKGFDVAHQREQRKRQESFEDFQSFNNLIVAIFTIVLASGIFSQTILMSESASKFYIYLSGAALAFLVITGGFFIYRKYSQIDRKI